MNDLIPTAAVEGTILYHGVDLYGPEVDPVEVRKRIGMVFQKPNPFPKSIYDNVAFGPRVLGWKKDLDERVERALRHAALWDEVKNRLKASALQPLGRPAAAPLHRALPRRRAGRAPDGRAGLGARPDLDDARSRISCTSSRREYTIVIVTHNMQQAARVADMTAFFSVEVDEEQDRRTGVLVEYDQTPTIFTNPSDKRTEDYVTGRFG